MQVVLRTSLAVICLALISANAEDTDNLENTLEVFDEDGSGGTEGLKTPSKIPYTVVIPALYFLRSSGRAQALRACVFPAIARGTWLPLTLRIRLRVFLLPTHFCISVYFVVRFFRHHPLAIYRTSRRNGPLQFV